MMTISCPWTARAASTKQHEIFRQDVVMELALSPCASPTAFKPAANCLICASSSLHGDSNFYARRSMPSNGLCSVAMKHDHLPECQLCDRCLVRIFCCYLISMPFSQCWPPAAFLLHSFGAWSCKSHNTRKDQCELVAEQLLTFLEGCCKDHWHVAWVLLVVLSVTL